MAAKRKGRSVQDLYNDTAVITQKKIASVLEGSCRVQGPVCETEQDIEKNMVPPKAEDRLGKRSMRKKVRTSAESGTCNVCSTPCSSCMHVKLTHMGLKEEEVSDETCRVAATSQYSNNDGNGSSSFKNRVYSSQHTTSEASNLLSVNSSLDSLSENAESKANIRSSDIADTSVESEMLPKLLAGGSLAEDPQSPKLILDQRPASNKHDDSSPEEGHDDSISCVSRANDISKASTCYNKNLERKDLSCSSTLVSGLGLEGSNRTVILPKSDLLVSPNDADAGGSGPPSNGNGVSHDKVKQVELPMGNINSSFLREGTSSNIACGNNLAAQSSADNFPTGKSTSSGDAPKDLNKACPNLDSKVDKDNGDERDEGFKCSDRVEKDEKSNELVELPGEQEPLQSASDDETDESEILEHDVKVCDICGDAGREDLLAICSRCTDGAEHTYCMREMLQKVPEGEWLCEECKMAEENETSKQGSDTEDKRVKASTQSLGKRHAETIEVAPASKRQAIETSLGSPKPSSSPNRMVALSRDSLDKGKVKPVHQASVGNQSSIDTSEISRSSAGLRLQSPKGTLLKSNSFNTINSKPKVKLVDGVPQKHKGTRENSSLDMKEGPARIISKSVSFKSSNSGRTSGSEPKVKMLSTKFPHVQDTKGLKQVKDRTTFERKNLTKLERPLSSSGMTSSSVSTPKADQKLTPRGEAVMVSSTNSNRESKGDGKLGILSRSASNLARKVTDTSVAPVRLPSINGTSSASIEQKLNQVSPKDEPSSSSSWTAEKFCNNANEPLLDGVSRSRELSNQDEKSRESSVTRLRPAGFTGPKNVTCQQCKETGHTAEYCMTVSPRTSCTEISTGRSVREEMSKGSKLKAAIEAAMLKKPGICRKKKESDQSDGLSPPNIDASSELPSQDKFSAWNKMNEEVLEGQANPGSSSSDSFRQSNINNVKQLNTRCTDAKVGESESSIPSVGKANHAPAAMPILMKMAAIPEHEYIWQGGFEVRRVGKLVDLYGGIQAHLSTCASPKVLDVVDKFSSKITLDEVPRLSTWPRQFQSGGAREDNIALYFFAKDLESYTKDYKGLLDNMIKKDLALKGSFDGVELLIFPSTQLPDNSQRWNMLFFLWGVFRGRRSDSSESLKKKMIPSLNIVPVHGEIPTAVMSSENICFPERLNNEKCPRDSSCDVTVPFNAPERSDNPLNGDVGKRAPCLQTKLEQQDGGSESKSSSKFARTGALVYPESARTSLPLEEATPRECRLDKGLETSTQVCGTSGGSNGKEETQMREDAPHAGQDASSFEVFRVGGQGLGVKGSISDDKIVDRMYSDRDKVKVGRDLNEDDVDVDTSKVKVCRDLNEDGMDVDTNKVKVCRDLNEDGTDVDTNKVKVCRDLNEDGMDVDTNKVKVCRDLNEDGMDVDTNKVKVCRDLNEDGIDVETKPSLERVTKKRPYLDLSESIPQTSSCTSQTTPWNDVDSTSVDGEIFSKKLKTGFSGLYGGSGLRDGNSFGDGFASQACDLGSSSSMEDKSCDEKIILEDLGANERYFFPVGSHRLQDFRLGSNSLPWKEHPSNDENRFQDGIPNLELALGAETKYPNKGILPFFVGMEKSNSRNRPPDKVTEKGEEDAASLSLSLSFPFPEKEQTVKPSKTEQLLPERGRLNTSLLLFGGLSEK